MADVSSGVWLGKNQKEVDKQLKSIGIGTQFISSATAIDLSKSVVVINNNSPIVATIGRGLVDGQRMVISSAGTGHTVSGQFVDASDYSGVVLQSTDTRGYLELIWSAAKSKWIVLYKFEFILTDS